MPPGTPQAEAVAQAGQPAIDPNVAAVLQGLQTVGHGIAALERVATTVVKPAAQAADTVVKEVRAKGVSALVVMLAIGSGAIFGIGGAAVGVWIHDQSTRGTISTRLDNQDRAINGLIDAVNAVNDEGEEADAWLCQALSDGFGKPITCRSIREREKIRRGMPSKIQPQ